MNYRTVNQFVAENPAISLGWLRAAIFHASTNGFAEHKVIKRLGRKVLINTENFNAWLEAQ